MKLEPVPLSAIDLSDTTYRISLAEPDEALRDSLKRIGLLHPPLLRQSPDGLQHRIVCGFRRIACALQLDWESMPALLLETPEAGPRDCLLRNYRENRLLRELHLCEKAQLVDKLHGMAGLSDAELLSDVLIELQLPANRTTLDRLLRIHRWPRELQRSAFLADLAPQPLMRLADLDPEEAAAVIRLLCGFRWSHSRQKQLLSILLDVAAMQNRSVKALAAEIHETARSKDPNRPLPQKAEEIRQQLRRLRYPRVTRTEAEYRRLRQALRLGPEVIFQEPPEFEGDRYRVEFQFRDGREYARILQQLQQAAATPEFEALLELL